MKAIDAARSARVHAEQSLGTYGQNNKKVRGVSPQNPQEYEHKLRGDAAIERLQRAAPMWGASMQDVIEHGRAAIREHAGNCMECCAVACVSLEEMADCPPFDVVQLEPPGDHVFVVIGQLPDAKGRYPKKFSAWDADAAICDPWAGIDCLARDYPTEWANTMSRWDSAKMTLPRDTRVWTRKGGSPTVKSGGIAWVSPRDTFWLDGITECEKRSFTRKPDKAQKGGCCYLTTATCTALGLGDDCHELTVLRGFRDRVLLATAAGREDVARYYATAPGIVEAIDARHDARSVYERIYRETVAPAVAAVERGDHATAHALFAEAVESAGRILPAVAPPAR